MIKRLINGTSLKLKLKKKKKVKRQATDTDGEKIFVNHISEKRLVSKILLLQLNKMTNCPVKKMSKKI